MKISVCIITKNEAKKLERCLASVKGKVDEIVVVDTGSTDDTKNIIKKYADVTGDFVWCDDFSKARNYSISLANNDWILVLDSDEWIEEFDAKEILKAVSNGDLSLVGRIKRRNIIATNGVTEVGYEYISRVFNRKKCVYRGRIHEQISSFDGAGNVCVELPLTIGHDGYAGNEEDKNKKALRNIELLLMDLEEYGDEPYSLYQLGKGYYMQQQFQEAAGYFERGLGFDLDPKLEYVQDMVETYGYTLLKLNRRPEMMFLENIYDEFAVSADYVFLMGLAYMNNEMFEKAIEQFEKATSFAYCKMEGCNSYKALYNAGVIFECLGQKEKAGAYYRKCGKYEPALTGLERLKQVIK